MRTHEYFRADAGGGALPSDMLVETWRHTRNRRTSEKSTERERESSTAGESLGILVGCSFRLLFNFITKNRKLEDFLENRQRFLTL